MLNIPDSSASVHTSQTTHLVTMATVLVCITMYHRQNTAIVVTMTTYKHPHTLAWAQTWASIVRVQSLTAKSHGTAFQKLSRGHIQNGILISLRLPTRVYTKSQGCLLKVEAQNAFILDTNIPMLVAVHMILDIKSSNK